MPFVSIFLNQQIRPRHRLYAITFKNKILAAYFGALTLARLAMALTTAFLKPPTLIELLPEPLPVPIDALNACGMVVDLRLMLIPSSLGTTFGVSLR